MASTTRSAPASASSRSVVGRTRSRAAVASSAESTASSTSSARDSSMAAKPPASRFGAVSCSRTAAPAWAKSCAMPWPITPLPITATARSIGRSSREEDYRSEALMASRTARGGRTWVSGRVASGASTRPSREIQVGHLRVDEEDAGEHVAPPRRLHEPRHGADPVRRVVVLLQLAQPQVRAVVEGHVPRRARVVVDVDLFEGRDEGELVQRLWCSLPQA